jgi:hypothetical protein
MRSCDIHGNQREDRTGLSPGICVELVGDCDTRRWSRCLSTL